MFVGSNNQTFGYLLQVMEFKALGDFEIVLLEFVERELFVRNRDLINLNKGCNLGRTALLSAMNFFKATREFSVKVAEKAMNYLSCGVL